MTKFMVLFKSTQSASEQMAGATPEQMQASMNEWITWKDNLDVSLVFEWGLPLQAVANIIPAAVQPSDTTVSGYAIMQGDKDAVATVLQTHPHLKRDGASIDLLEMLSMPGM